ncbi:MAG TPA: hypothetical protein PKD61_09350 [Polyangiaceae bacterium]|nr:hypothetical protein [Polyangiaceae bacterium]
MYEKLDENKIVLTIEQLELRIQERFPKASLAGVAKELLGIASVTIRRTATLREPNLPLRVGVGLLLCGGVLVLALMAPEARLNYQIRAITELVQTLEALLGSLFFLGTGVAFLVTLESRLKRKVALALVHQLRALAHIVDMHQLTKDPSELTARGPSTPSSPKRTMTDFELMRYLNYCTELLALVSKVGALTVQGYTDPVVLNAVDEVENLTTALSQKIWQKITLLETELDEKDESEARDAARRRSLLLGRRFPRAR